VYLFYAKSHLASLFPEQPFHRQIAVLVRHLVVIPPKSENNSVLSLAGPTLRCPTQISVRSSLSRDMVWSKGSTEVAI
jgi:hypothetical protein